MKKTLHWLDENLEEFLLVVMLAAMTLIMGIQIFSRYALGQSLSWSEEVTRFLFIWSGFLSVSYCSKKCLSIKIEQFVAAFPRRGKALFKVVNHTFELIFFPLYDPICILLHDVRHSQRTVIPRLRDSDVLYSGSAVCFLSSGNIPHSAALDHRI